MGRQQMPPMDGALAGSVPADPNMGQPMDNTAPNPPMGGEDPTMGGDPSMGGEEPMDNGGMPQEGDDSTMSIINQLSPDDKEAVRNYAESMLARDETQNNPNGEMGGDPMMDGGNDGQMMESVIFTKRQINKICENFNQKNNDDENLENKPLGKKKGKTVSKNSPFNNPKFD